jgi:O-antigen/teichoic acid export membrane protein
MKSQLLVVTIILSFLCLIIFWLGEPFIFIVYGEPFVNAYKMLLWGLPGTFSLGLVSIYSQYLAAIGIPVILLWIWFTGIIVEAVLAIWLIPLLGGLGAMVSLSATYILIFASVWTLSTYSNKKLKVGNYAD